MTQASQSSGASITGGPRCWNVCVEHQPAHAGLYRGIRDFARALPGGILSFDGRFQDAFTRSSESGVTRISCGSGWLAQRCHVVNEAARRAADSAVAGADLLAVHSLFRGHCRWAWQWGRRMQRPYWVVPHGCLDPAGLARHFILKRLWMRFDGGKFFADSAAIVFATRREMAKAAASIPGLLRQTHDTRTAPHGAVIPWPIDLPTLANIEAKRLMFRTRLGIEQESPILLWVGRFHAGKRPIEAIRAFAKASPSGCHLVVIGLDETFTSDDLRSAIPLNVSGRIHVLGELHGDSLAEAWLAADGYLSLSAKENFGYAMADALAHGLPVILSPGHDLAYELPHTDQARLACGWLLPDCCETTAIQAIQEWHTLVTAGDRLSPARKRLHAVARNWVAENLAFDRFQSRLEDLAEITRSG